MKYYSEKLDKLFEDAIELEKAEKVHDEKVKEAKAKAEEAAARKKAEAIAISKDKKILCDEIDAAQLKLKEAYKNLNVVKEEAAKKLEEAKQEFNSTIEPARQEVKHAQNNLQNAILRFNKKYGIYSKTYTTDDVLEEFYMMNSYFNDIFNSIF